MISITSTTIFSSLFALALSTSVTDIQGIAFQSPLAGKTVHNVTGVVTAKTSNGFFITGEPVDDVRISNGLSIFSTSKTVLAKVSVGDNVSLSGVVSEFRSDSNDLFGTEIDSPTDIVILSSNNTLTPVILGVDRSPPTQDLSALDVGPDGILSVPNNVSRIETVNATLVPTRFGLDFWSSLEGQLVKIPSPIAIDFENEFGEFWVRGNWPVTGGNGRGGLTITANATGDVDTNPEMIIVGTPLDDTDNPTTAIGKRFTDVVGIVQYQFGFYYVRPLTAPSVTFTPDSTVPVTNLTSSSTVECTLTIGDYNIDNMAPTSPHMGAVATHIAIALKTPDIVFVQEIQDNSGSTDDGTVIANLTLSNLVAEIANASNGVVYDFLEIAPVNDQDGGQPGGNIRQAYLYRPEKLSLVPGSPAGGSLDAVEVTTVDGQVGLNFNPGRIDPTSDAWDSSRKPLVALWETPCGHRLFTVNLHLTAKLGSSSTWGDARPPVNELVEQRTSQVSEVATFVTSVLAKDSSANIVVAGDCNEFLQTRSVFASLETVMKDIDEVAGIDPVERYTYVFDGNTEQLDHMFLSEAIQSREAQVEHVHVNNWSPSFDARASDHDPTVGKIQLC